MCLPHIYNSNSMRCACDVGTLKYVDQKRSNQFIRFSYSAAYTNAIMRHILNSDLTKRICTRTKCDNPQTKTACFFSFLCKCPGRTGDSTCKYSEYSISFNPRPPSSRGAQRTSKSQVVTKSLSEVQSCIQILWIIKYWFYLELLHIREPQDICDNYYKVFESRYFNPM